MSERLSEREKLIKRINEAMFRDEDKGCVKPSEIADWHLAEVKRIVEPLVNSEKIIEANNADVMNQYVANQERKNAIKETLKRSSGGE